MSESSLVSIDGLIAVGKTSLCRRLETFGKTVVYEKMDDDFLALFYENPIRYGFVLQLSTMESRVNTTKTAEAGAYLDRSPVGDLAFATVNHGLGRITDREFRIYQRKLYNGAAALCVSSCIDRIKTFMWLWDEPAKCLERAKKYVSRPYDVTDGITQDYMTALDDTHFGIMCHLAASTRLVHLLKFGEYDGNIRLLPTSGTWVLPLKAVAVVKAIKKYEHKTIRFYYPGGIPETLKLAFINDAGQ